MATLTNGFFRHGTPSGLQDAIPLRRKNNTIQDSVNLSYGAMDMAADLTLTLASPDFTVCAYKCDGTIFDRTPVGGTYHIDAGSASISGTVKIGSTPVMRKVLVMTENTKKIIGSAWSDPDTGEWEVAGLPPGGVCLVIAEDHTGTYNDVVAARVVTA